MLGQTVFWYKPRHFRFPKVVRAVISDSRSREILLSWKLLRKRGVISSSFPYPPSSHTEKAESDDDAAIDDLWVPHDYKARCVREEDENPALQVLKDKLLVEYSDVFKEDLLPAI